MMDLFRKNEEIDIFSKKPLFKISILDRCTLKIGNSTVTISASECIKWLSIHNMETVPYFPNTKIPFHKMNRMKCYYQAQEYYDAQMVKDDDLIICLTKVWQDEMYRKNPLQIINYYYQKYHNNNICSDSIKKSTNITKKQLEFIIRDIQTKIKKNYFV